MVRRTNKLATLLVLVVCVAVAVAQGPSDTGNAPPGTPVTPAPGVPTPAPGAGTSPTVTTASPVPTTPPPGVVPVTTTPAPTPPTTPPTKRPGADTGSSDADANTPKTTTPAPSKTTKPPVVNAAAPAATPATPVPSVTTTAPEILIDRQAKSEYGTRSPIASDSTTQAEGKSEASKMGGWLVPAVIGAVIISALIIMTFFMRSRRSGNADEDYNTPRRGSENFMEHPKSTQHQVTVPVLGDPVKDKVAGDSSSMRTVAVGGAHHSPRANRVASSPPLMTELNRPPSPGFGTYKQKHMEGTSVGF